MGAVTMSLCTTEAIIEKEAVVKIDLTQLGHVRFLSEMWRAADSELWSVNVNSSRGRWNVSFLFFFLRFYKRLTRRLMGRLVTVKSAARKTDKLEMKFIRQFHFRESFIDSHFNSMIQLSLGSPWNKVPSSGRAAFSHPHHQRVATLTAAEIEAGATWNPLIPRLKEIN